MVSKYWYNINNLIKHHSFACTQLNGQTVLFNSQKRLSCTTTPDQSGPRRNGNKVVLHIPESSILFSMVSRTLGKGFLPFCWRILQLQTTRLTVIIFQVFISNNTCTTIWFQLLRILILCAQLYGPNNSYLILIICTKLYGFKYSYLNLITYTNVYGFKHSYQRLMICSSLYGFTYSYVILIICTQLYCFFYLILIKGIHLYVFTFSYLILICTQLYLPHSAGAAEYTYCIFAEG